MLEGSFGRKQPEDLPAKGTRPRPARDRHSCVVLLVQQVDHRDAETRAAQAANSVDAAGELGGRLRRPLTERTERRLGHDHHRPLRLTVELEGAAAVAA
jgi:hypothetical protein